MQSTFGQCAYKRASSGSKKQQFRQCLLRSFTNCETNQRVKVNIGQQTHVNWGLNGAYRVDLLPQPCFAGFASVLSALLLLASLPFDTNIVLKEIGQDLSPVRDRLIPAIRLPFGPDAGDDLVDKIGVWTIINCESV